MNGKEIYEGDIISHNRRGGVIADPHTYLSEVFWNTKYLCWGLSNNSEQVFERAINLEVIGNIFENPELIK